MWFSKDVHLQKVHSMRFCTPCRVLTKKYDRRSNVVIELVLVIGEIISSDTHKHDLCIS